MRAVLASKPLSQKIFLGFGLQKGSGNYSFDKAQAEYENDHYCRSGFGTEVAAAEH